MESNQINFTAHQKSVIGVDLGSSKIKVGAAFKRGVQILSNQANFRLTPNVVGFGEGERLIGQAGSSKIKSNYANTISAPNRYLAFSDNCPYLQQQCLFCPAELKLEDSSAQFEVKCYGEKQEFTVEQITAALITKIEDIVLLNKIQTNNFVVAVPDYMTHLERQSLKNSLEIAIKNKYDFHIINESEAIAYDYGFYRINQFQNNPKVSKNVLFIDIGHSKTICSVIKFTSQESKVISQRFRRQLGCKNFDKKILEFYSQKFEKQNPDLNKSLLKNKKALLKLLDNIEKQRKVLSGNYEHDLNIDYLHEERDLSHLMKRKQYEDLLATVIAQFKELFNQIKEDISENNIQIDAIELVGGGTRIPILLNSLKEIFTIDPSRTINSDECIALGATLISADFSSIFKTNTFKTTVISNYAINLNLSQIQKQNTISNEQIQFIGIDEEFPQEKQISIVVKSGVQKILCNLEYGAVQEGIDSQIMKFQIDTKNMSDSMDEQGVENKILIKIKFNNLMISNLSAIWVKNNQQNSLRILNVMMMKALKSQDLQRKQELQIRMKDRDLKIVKLYEKRNELESKIYSNRDKIQDSLKNNCLKQFIPPQLYADYQKFLQEMQLWVISDCEHTVEQYCFQFNHLEGKMKIYFDTINTIKNKYNFFEKELKVLDEFIDRVINGHRRTRTHNYPEDFNQAYEWVIDIIRKQKQRPKWQETIVSVQQLQNNHEHLKKILQKHKQLDEQRKRDQEFSSFRPTHSMFQPSSNFGSRGRKSGWRSPMGEFNNNFPGFF